MGATVAGRADAVDRHQLFFGLFLVTTLNGFAGHFVRAWSDADLLSAIFNLFGVSSILWVALAAGLHILFQQEQRQPVERGDLAVALALFAAALFPAPTASAAALAAGSLWAIFTSRAGSPLRRSGIIFLAITGSLLWGRLVLATFSGPLLEADAVFVAALVGAEHSGTCSGTGRSRTEWWVAPGCSSMQGMSLALVFWATVNQFFEVRFTWKAVACCLAALAATIAINVMRIGAMLRWPEQIDEIHHGWGYQLSMWVTLILVVAICLWGGRREIFPSR
jgi:exosortase/archaeosortase family protein